MVTDSAPQLRVVEAEKSAVEAMRKAGFDPGESIKVSVDPRLPFMGYSRPDGDGYSVVVSGGAVESELLEGLLMHELSHIYRMRTGHPSHDAQVVGEAVGGLQGFDLRPDYKQKVIYDLTNNIQDLYADDIAIRVMRKEGLARPEQLSRFFQDWVKEEVVAGRDATKARWLNGWTMANNARALAQMARHGVQDLDGRASDANRRFLGKVDPSIAGRFGYFLDLMTNLREDITGDGYRRLLTEYLGTFVEMVEGRSL